MSNLLIAVLIGLTAGLIDSIPMLLRKMDKTACLSAFVHYFVLGLIIPFVDWNLPPLFTGMLVAILCALPVMIIVYPKEKMALIPMTIFAIILGAGIGWAGAEFIG